LTKTVAKKREKKAVKSSAVAKKMTEKQKDTLAAEK